MSDVDMTKHAKVLEMFPRPRIEAELVIDGVRFETSRYNQGADMLTVHSDDFQPRHPWVDDTPEGHYTIFALDGSLNQVTFVSPKRQLARDGFVAITAREGGPTERIAREVIEAMFIDTIWPEEVTRLLCDDVEQLSEQAGVGGAALNEPAAWSPRPNWPPRARRPPASRSARRP